MTSKPAKINNENVVLYYAGLDRRSFPFGEGDRLAKARANDQILFLKTLSLVCDYIVIPPSTYFSWANYQTQKELVIQLHDLHQSGIVISSIYDSMSSNLDYLQYKVITAPEDERHLINNRLSIIEDIFFHIPVVKRNVSKQVKGFKEQLLYEFSAITTTNEIKDKIFRQLETDTFQRAIPHRDKISKVIEQYFLASHLSRGDYRKFYYAINKSYYTLGALTYNSFISIAGAERYSIFAKTGRNVFSESSYRIMVAYDPLVLLGILRLLGINEPSLRVMSIAELMQLRNTDIFPSFKCAYLEFARTLQDLHLAVGSMTRSAIDALKKDLTEGFMSRYFLGIDSKQKHTNTYNLSEMLVFSFALGALGFFVIPVMGAILGLLSPLLYVTGASEKISSVFFERYEKKEREFYLFIDELKGLIKVVEERQSNQSLHPTRGKLPRI